VLDGTDADDEADANDETGANHGVGPAGDEAVADDHPPSEIDAGARARARSESAEPTPHGRERVAFSALARAAYCPRQLYYHRREREAGEASPEPPPAARERIALAFRYPALRRADDATLAAAPVEPPPGAYRAALDRLAERDDWADLCDPPARRVLLAGRDCRGVAHKLLPGEPPTPTLVSPGEPPERGVWAPQRVRAVASALALAWERERAVERALVEYPAHGVVRTVRLTTRNRARYRRTLRTVRSLDGPPPRLHDDARCGACEYRTECGVRTRSLGSLLGL
jgi:CRISPR-associated exonuclease Cas4